MKIYVVYYYYHYDDYKRADGFADVIDVYSESENAYKCAVENFMKSFIDYAKYNWDDIECDEHIIDKYFLSQCEICGNTITENCELDLNDEDNLFSKYHLRKVFNDNKKTWKEKYDFIKDNLYKNILNKPEFTMQPTHENYFVKEFSMYP
jgi:hypothetical protein